MTDQPLKPCPFCGGELVNSEGNVQSNKGVVNCCDCGCSGPHPAYDSQERVIAWNTRTPTPAEPQGGAPEVNHSDHRGPDVIYIGPFWSRPSTDQDFHDGDFISVEHEGAIAYIRKDITDAALTEKSKRIAELGAAKPIAELECAVKELTDHQQQLDMDGIMVGISRQALNEVLVSIREPKAFFDQLAKARNDAIEEAIDELESGMYLTAAALISVLKTDTGEW